MLYIITVNAHLAKNIKSFSLFHVHGVSFFSQHSRRILIYLNKNLNYILATEVN